MDWCVIRHPETGGLAVVAADALPHHEQALGWQRVSEWRSDQTTFVLDDYTDADPVTDEPADTADQNADADTAEGETTDKRPAKATKATTKKEQK